MNKYGHQKNILNKICLSSINLTITTIHLLFVRAIFFFFPQFVFSAVTFFGHTVCAARPQEKNIKQKKKTHDICSVVQKKDRKER